MRKIIGIDISKAKFDAFILEKSSHQEFINASKGFNQLLKNCDKDTIVIMESSGYYHTPLAYFLYKHGVKVSVVNPLVIKRFSQMQLNRAKTDKKDAQTIANYALYHQPSLWIPESKATVSMKQVFTAQELLDKQIRQIKGQLESLAAAELKEKLVVKEFNSLLRILKRKQSKLDLELKKIAQNHFKDTYENLQSIPGLGPKTAAMLIAITDDFNKFSHYKQLIA